MTLAAGTKLGPYEILAPLGAGGMGEVYRARDTKLARDVALKVLPEAFAKDCERMARFQREAQMLASLNHPNIASIYGLEESGGVCALVIVYFRKVRTSAEVLGSLTVGVVLMSGVAALAHIKINFFNFIVYPITFGIAIDYGANVAARVIDRGGHVLEAVAEVGPAVALCSWTTIIGYGSLLISLNRALRSFGQYAVIGEVTTILTALVLLPALLIIAGRERHSTKAESTGVERAS